MFEIGYLRRRGYYNEIYYNVIGIVLRGEVLDIGKRKFMWRYREYRYLYVKVCLGKLIRIVENKFFLL